MAAKTLHKIGAKPLKELKAVEIGGKTKIAVSAKEGAQLIDFSPETFRKEIQPYLTPYSFGGSKTSRVKYLVSDIIDEFMKHARDKKRVG